jgi:hypothetical protein
MKLRITVTMEQSIESLEDLAAHYGATTLDEAVSAQQKWIDVDGGQEYICELLHFSEITDVKVEGIE